MPSLFPSFPAPPAVVANTGTGAVRYGRSWEFDFQAGDFRVDGTGRIHPVDGHSAWVQWCVKTVLTPRQAFLAYTGGYGCEVLEAMRLAATRLEVESEVTRTISEALMADPRTRSVRDFTFTWSGDELRVSFIAEPIIGTAERLEVALNG